ncbi:MAG: hypothetical protein ACYDC1_06600 [Limisphaerales bacterium]
MSERTVIRLGRSDLLLVLGSRLFLQGDLHGDIRSLLAVVGRLQERQCLP